MIIGELYKQRMEGKIFGNVRYLGRLSDSRRVAFLQEESIRGTRRVRASSRRRGCPAWRPPRPRSSLSFPLQIFAGDDILRSVGIVLHSHSIRNFRTPFPVGTIYIGNYIINDY